MISDIEVKVMGEVKRVPAGISYQELANEYKST